MNRQESAKIVAIIVASCPGQSSKLDGKRLETMVDAFSSLLEDISYAAASAAVRSLLQTSTWMPSVAEIRSAVQELVAGPQAPGGEAWGAVRRAIQREGVHRQPGVDFGFADQVAAKCVAALGWTELCSSENQVSDRARFVELYDRLASQDRRETLSPILAAARDSRQQKNITSDGAVRAALAAENGES